MSRSKITTYADTLIVGENSGPTAINIPAPTSSQYPTSKLTITVAALPGDGTVLLSDGVPAVTDGQVLTVPQLTGLEFKPTPWTFGQSSTFSYSVTDPSGLSATGTATLAVAADVLLTTAASLVTTAASL